MQIDFVRCDVRQVVAQQRLRADTVVMNPPFGTRRKGGQGVLVVCLLGVPAKVCSNAHPLQTLHTHQRWRASQPPPPNCRPPACPALPCLPCPPCLPRPQPSTGADIEFLRAAFQLSQHSVYSLHKSSTRDFIQRLADKELRAASGKHASRGACVLAWCASCCTHT